MVRPGLLMDWEAAEINAALTDLRMLREQVGQLVVPPVDRPWMKLTAYDSGTGYYSWTEQDHNATGGFLDKSGGRTGTTTWQPAKELNGEVISSFPHYVRADRAVRTTTVGPLYYFTAAADGGSSAYRGYVGLNVGESYIIAPGTIHTLGSGQNGTANTGMHLLAGSFTIGNASGSGIASVSVLAAPNPASLGSSTFYPPNPIGARVHIPAGGVVTVPMAQAFNVNSGIINVVVYINAFFSTFPVSISAGSLGGATLVELG